MAGKTSLLAFWIGGTASPEPAQAVRSMLAFWSGGAHGDEFVAPVAQEVKGGLPWWLRDFLQQQQKEEQLKQLLARLLLLID